MKKLFSVLISVLLVFSATIPSFASTNNYGYMGESTFINPIYSNLQETKSENSSNVYTYNAPLYNSTTTYGTYDAAIKWSRDQMKKRVENFTTTFSYTDYGVYDTTLASDLLKKAISEEYSNSADTGDYLYLNLDTVSCTIYRTEVNSKVSNYAFYYTADYLSTADEEKQVTSAVNKLISSEKLNEGSDYQKIKKIYDYMCKNITYDRENMYEYFSHSTYSAIIKKNTVCQGYSSLFYRLAKEVGLKPRCITSSSHAWNIVYLNGIYYNLDATNDASVYGTSKYGWLFLKGMKTFNNANSCFIRDREHSSDEFNAKYPTSDTDYVVTKLDDLVCEENVSSGAYKITSALNNNISLNFEYSKDNGAKLKLTTKSTANIGDFKVQYNSKNQSYTILSDYSDKALDVPSASTKIKTNLQQYTSNGTNAQSWVIEPAGDGYFYIISKLNGLYLDIPSGNAEENALMQLYTGNKSNAQKFKFEKIDELTGDELVPSGEYKITTAVDNSKILRVTNGDNKTKVTLGNDTNAKFQNFKLQYDSKTKSYSIINSASGKALDVAGAGRVNKTVLWQYSKNDTRAQQWILEDAGDGYFYILSKCNGLYLDIPGGKATNGNSIQLYAGNKSNAQKFKFEDIAELQSENVLNNGTYKIHSALDYSKVLDVNGASMQNGANIQIWSNSNVSQKMFNIAYNDAQKYYTITSEKSSKSLDISGAGAFNKSNVQQYTENGTSAQQWILIPDEKNPNYYYIISKCNGLALDINGAKTDNGTNVQVYELNKSNAQKFYFEKMN